jgi:hypothetical protein
MPLRLGLYGHSIGLGYVIACCFTSEAAVRILLKSFVRGEEEHKKTFGRSNRPRISFQRRLSIHG